MHLRRPAVRLFLLAGALCAAAAAAEERSARLLDGAPTLARLTPAVGPLAQGAVDVAAAQATNPGPDFGTHFGKTVGMGVVGVTAGAVAGHFLGSLSNDLIGAAVPGALCNLIIGPVLTVIGALLVGNDGEWSGRYGFWGPLGVALGINAVVYVLTSFLIPVAWANPLELLVYSLVDGVLMTGGAVGLMHLVPTTPRATTSLPSFIPGITDTQVVTLSEVKL